MKSRVIVAETDVAVGDDMAENTGWKQTKAIWKNTDTRLFYKLLGAAVLVGIGVLAGRWVYGDYDAWGYGINVFTSVMSTIATVLIVDEFSRRRSTRDAETALKRQLVMDAGSISNEIAKNAVHQMQRLGWLEGENGLLKGTDLSGANLQGANFFRSNLQGAVLRDASLQGANLWGANLQAADLGFTHLIYADLSFANMQRAFLQNANLVDASLEHANLHKATLAQVSLERANLFDANLQEADLWNARFDVKTTLPDQSNWTAETDMRQFTDPKHPDFWQSWNLYEKDEK